MVIYIVTDSSADLPKKILQENDIRVVPLTIRVNGKEYREGIDISPQEFYQEMYASQELPSTSQPSPSRFGEVFKELSAKGKVLCLTISSQLSGSFESANLGKNLAGNPNVTVFDTLAGSIGHGLQVLKAAEYVKEGYSLESIVAKLTKMREEMRLLILLDTLENIVKGGRLTRFQGSMANLLNIKVILHNVEGSVEILEKIRGRNRFLQRAVCLAGERYSDFSERTIGITHVDNKKDAEYLAEDLEKRYKPRQILINEMGATIASYAGKAGLIVAF